MAGLVKTNDAGVEIVTRWIWVDSKKRDAVLQSLIVDNLIEKQDAYNPQTLSYFKVTTTRENIKKIEEAIKKFNMTSRPQDEPFNPPQDWGPSARLAPSTPLTAKLDDDTRKYSRAGFNVTCVIKIL